MDSCEVCVGPTTWVALLWHDFAQIFYFNALEISRIEGGDGAGW